jgi:DNA-binding XRE family transcriptional regulator
MKEFKDILKEKRVAKGLTQQKLAKRLDVSYACACKWEQGLTSPNILLAADMADLFECSVNELVGWVRPRGLANIKPRPFGEILSEKRAEWSLSQVALASLLSVSEGAVDNWEKGNCYPTLPTVARLAQIFNCSIDELVGRRVK